MWLSPAKYIAYINVVAWPVSRILDCALAVIARSYGITK
jgi:hypothetical protein